MQRGKRLLAAVLAVTVAIMASGCGESLPADAPALEASTSAQSPSDSQPKSQPESESQSMTDQQKTMERRERWLAAPKAEVTWKYGEPYDYGYDQPDGESYYCPACSVVHGRRVRVDWADGEYGSDQLEAQLWVDDKVAARFRFPLWIGNLSVPVGIYEENAFTRAFAYSWDSDRPLVTITDEASGGELTLDFDQSTAQLVYPEPRPLPAERDEYFEYSYKPKTSPDGGYTLYIYSDNGSNNYGEGPLVLLENATGRKQTVTRIARSPFSDSPVFDFLPDGRFYLQGDDGVQVYNLPDGAPLWQLQWPEDRADSFTLFATGHYPETNGLVVLYSQLAGEEQGRPYSETEQWTQLLDSNYRIGFTDEQGEILRSYDTGLPVFDTSYTSVTGQIRMRGDKVELALQSIGYYGSRPYYKGYFDPRSLTYIDHMSALQPAP